MNGRLGAWCFAAVALAAATPCLAGAENAAGASAAAERPAVTDPCAQALAPFGALEAVFQLSAPEGVEAIPLAGGPPGFRTCVCSCGYPCKTDADCGPGGNCGPGITCCATPIPGVAPGPGAEKVPAEASVGP